MDADMHSCFTNKLCGVSSDMKAQFMSLLTPRCYFGVTRVPNPITYLRICFYESYVTNYKTRIFAYQAERVVCVHELLRAILLQHHHIGQVGAALTSTILTVNHVCLPAIALTCHKQQVEHLQLGQRGRNARIN